jgi:hypothetical protein
LSELLARRTSALVNSNSELACRMAVYAALWDLAIAGPVLRAAAQLKSCRAQALVTVARLSLGDVSAAADWAAEIRDRPKFPPLTVEDLSPLWMFPGHPVLELTADWLFARAESPWFPGRHFQFVHSPLLSVPSYRRAVMQALQDSGIIGKATRSAEGLLSFSVENGSGGSSESGSDPRQVAPRQEFPVRVMDVVTWQLSRLEGARKFELDWPEQDKNAVISDIAKFLSTDADRLRPFPGRLQDVTCVGERVYIDKAASMPKLQ